MTKTQANPLPWTGNPEADRYLVEEPLAFVLGFLLDQQITIEKAFGSPLVLRDRLGGPLTARGIAEMDEETLVTAFCERPALHRFPAAMARRAQALCRIVVDRYDGRVERLWLEAENGEELARRIRELPGFGDMKARIVVRALGARLGIRPPGWEDAAADFLCLGDVDGPEMMATYRATKREKKAEARRVEAAKAPGVAGKSKPARRAAAAGPT